LDRIDVLFIPVSGPMGMGELVQCAILAQALKAAQPALKIACLVHQAVLGRVSADWLEIALDSTPTASSAKVIAYLQHYRPRVVIFDSAGRAAQLRAAKGIGAHCIFMAGRESSRRKAMSWRRLPYLDELWLCQPLDFWQRLPLWKRLLMRFFPTLKIVPLGVLFAPADPSLLPTELEQFSRAQPFVLITLGGGGVFSAGIAQNDLAEQAAQAVFAATGVPSILLCGPNANRLPAASAACAVVRSVPNAALVALLERATLVLCNGGYTLLQAVALRKVTLALALQGDQQRRIDRLLRCDATQSTTVSALAQDLIALLKSPEQQAARIKATHASGVENGLTNAIRRLLEVLP
jgi:UDP:flavonoid glycosyltransferase YjiC (YdhE family)